MILQSPASGGDVMQDQQLTFMGTQQHLATSKGVFCTSHK